MRLTPRGWTVLILIVWLVAVTICFNAAGCSTASPC